MRDKTENPLTKALGNITNLKPSKPIGPSELAASDGYTDGPTKEDVGWWWLYREDWGWQPVCVAYHSFIQAGDVYRHPITPGMKWGQKVSPYTAVSQCAESAEARKSSQL